jgi:hypothetical protein
VPEGTGGVDGEVPVVAAGVDGLVLAVRGPAPLVPAHQQMPSPTSTTTMIPTIQPPPALLVAVRGRLSGRKWTLLDPCLLSRLRT